MPTFSPAPCVLPLRRARSDADLLGPVAAAGSAASVLLRLPRPRTLQDGGDDNSAPMEDCFDGAGKYLHEVERDLAGAEEYYGRALLACPGDADLLSLYGRVLWESDQDKDRADGYFQRAVQAAPADCYVLGSYASFLWDAEEDEDEEMSTAVPCSSPALVPAC